MKKQSQTVETEGVTDSERDKRGASNTTFKTQNLSTGEGISRRLPKDVYRSITLFERKRPHKYILCGLGDFDATGKYLPRKYGISPLPGETDAETGGRAEKLANAIRVRNERRSTKIRAVQKVGNKLPSRSEWATIKRLGLTNAYLRQDNAD